MASFVKLVAMKLDPTFWGIPSELFVNLAAGWFGAAFIVPALSKAPISLNLSILTLDTLLGILFLVVAFRLRKLGGKG